MAKKNKKKPTNETIEMESSEETLEVVDKKQLKKERNSKEQAKNQKVSKKNKKQANEKPKRHRVREVFSELKKVKWPTFKQACKQTGAVLVVVAIFMLVILGIDSLLNWIITLIVGI